MFFCILGKPEIQATVKGKMQREMGKSVTDLEGKFKKRYPTQTPSTNLHSSMKQFKIQ